MGFSHHKSACILHVYYTTHSGCSVYCAYKLNYSLLHRTSCTHTTECLHNKSAKDRQELVADWSILRKKFLPHILASKSNGVSYGKVWPAFMQIRFDRSTVHSY